MALLFIILILFLGIVFLLLEIIVFPGISVAGILGAVLLVLGIYFAYAYHGNTVGHIVLGGTILAVIVATILAFRYASWRSVSLQTEIKGSVESLKGKGIVVGDEGVTVSRLAPIGSVKIHGNIVEAKSRNGYIDSGETVKVVSLKNNALVVSLVLVAEKE